MVKNILRFTLPEGGAPVVDDNGAYVTFEEHKSALDAKEAEILRLHRQLAGAKLDARLGWERHAMANKGRRNDEALLAVANAQLAAATQEVERHREMLENAEMAATETQPSWGWRIQRILSALEMDFGDAASIDRAIETTLLRKMADQLHELPAAEFDVNPERAEALRSQFECILGLLAPNP